MDNSSISLDELVSEAKLAMKKNQYFILPGAYSQSYCDKVCKQMDVFKKGPGVEFNYENTEVRAWSSQKRSAEINQFFLDANNIITRITGKESQAGTVLAIKNTPLISDDDVNLNNRWHIDSWRSQLKVFLFLSDTSEESGAFEFIPNTNKLSFRVRQALRPNFFFDIRTIFNKKLGKPYQKISDEKIKSVLSRGYKAKTVLVPSGTLMIINPSYLIHRARPCLNGSRYALTSYFDVKEGYHDYQIE